MILLVIAVVLGSAASNTHGALSVILWTLAGGSLAIAMLTRTSAGRAVLARRLAAAKANAAAQLEKGRHEKQSLEKLKHPKPKIGKPLDEVPNLNELKDRQKRHLRVEELKTTQKESPKKRPPGR